MIQSVNQQGPAPEVQLPTQALAAQVQVFDRLMADFAALLCDNNSQSNSPANTPASTGASRTTRPAHTIPRNVQQFPHTEKLSADPARTEKAPVA